jgi:hypothetical protein
MKNLKQVVRPNSISRTARKVGIALLLSPDPVTDVAAVVMFGVYIATKSKSPIGPSAVYEETQRILSEMDSLF